MQAKFKNTSNERDEINSQKVKLEETIDLLNTNLAETASYKKLLIAKDEIINELHDGLSTLKTEIGTIKDTSQIEHKKLFEKFDQESKDCQKIAAEKAALSLKLKGNN